MKAIFSLLFFLLALFSNKPLAVAFDKPKTEMVTMVKKNQVVEITLQSSKPFLMANNRYILYIGDKTFMKSHQSTKEGKGFMVFYVPYPDLKNMAPGAAIYLSFGQISKGKTGQIEELCAQDNIPCWNLGKFEPNLIMEH